MASSVEADQIQIEQPSVYVELSYSGSTGSDSQDLSDSVNEVLRTPERDQYEDQALMALADIQSKCEIDYEALCTTTTISGIDLSSVSSFNFNSESLRSLFSNIVVEDSNLPTPVVAWYRRKLHEMGGIPHDHEDVHKPSGEGLKFLRDIQKHLQPRSLVGHIRRLAGSDRKRDFDHHDHRDRHDHAAADADAVAGRREAPRVHHDHIVQPPLSPNDGAARPLQPEPPRPRMMRGGAFSQARKLHEHHHDSDSESGSDREGGGRGHGRDEDRPFRDGPPPAGIGMWWDNLLRGEPHQPPPPPPPPPPAPERMGAPDDRGDGASSSFGVDLVPSLGFGSDGDSCMLTNFHFLSSPCQSSMVNLGQVRANYLFDTYSASVQSLADDWRNDHHDHHHGHPILALGLLGAAGYFFYRRHQKMKDIRRILTVIEANPELRAQIESAAGCQIPPRGKCGDCSSNAKCLFGRVGKVVFFLLAFYFVLLTSFGITTAILHRMSPPPEVCDARGDPDCGPGIFAALLLLGAVAVGEVALLSYVGRTFCSKCCGGGGAANSEDGDMGPPVVTNDHSWYPGQMYSALPSDSSHGGAAEMQTFSAHTGTGTSAVYAQTVKTTTITPMREVTPVSQVTML